MKAWAQILLAIALTGCLSFHAGPALEPPTGARFIELDGARFRYVDVGEGPAVVLVHGFASSLDVWRPVMKELAKSRRVLALDLKGFGYSSRAAGDYSPAAQARLVLELLDRRGVKRADFVGHSWGSSVVLAAALAEPKRVRRIVLMSAWVYEEQKPTFMQLQATGLGETLTWLFYDERIAERFELAFYDDALITEAMIEEAERAIARPGSAAAALAAIRAQNYEALAPRYASVTHDTLVLWGREDELATLRYGERLARDLPRARLSVLPRCGHFPMVEAAPAVQTAIDEFLQ